MRKNNWLRQKKMWRKRTRKKLKRKRKKERYKDPFQLIDKLKSFQIRHDENIIKKSKFRFHSFLEIQDFVDNLFRDNIIRIPRNFSLKDNYEESIKVIKRATSALYHNRDNKITIDFANCNSAEISAIFLLRVIILEYIEYFRKLDKSLVLVKKSLEVLVKESNNPRVNIQLLLLQFLNSADGQNIELVPISATGVYKGNRTQKHYLENKKGIASTIAVAYVNECLRRHGYELNPRGVNNLEGIISEVLNNAEDHSPLTEWYFTANLLEEPRGESDNVVGELNMSFLNFGYSYFEGFEQTKQENNAVYATMNGNYEYLAREYGTNGFTKDNLFTLFALQDGFSRLKFENESRGTGTMKFIKSFMDIGDYEDLRKNFSPYLQLLTGGTKLTCDNKFKPFKKNNLYFISLNEEQSLTKLPSKTHLEVLTSHFPGTLLSVKIYLNKEHLTKKIITNGGS